MLLPSGVHGIGALWRFFSAKFSFCGYGCSSPLPSMCKGTRFLPSTVRPILSVLKVFFQVSSLSGDPAHSLLKHCLSYTRPAVDKDVVHLF